MNVFSEVYEKSVEMLKTPQLHADWAPVESGLRDLLLPDGPAPGKSTVLDDLRNRGQDRQAPLVCPVVQTTYDPSEEQDAQEIYVKELALDKSGQALLASDERKRVWSIDLATHAVTQVSGPEPR